MCTHACLNYTDLYFQCQDKISEVLDKWDAIDDEVWAKVIVLKRNRRVRKAYAKTLIMSINGSNVDLMDLKLE